MYRHVEHVMGMAVSFASRAALPSAAISDAVRALHAADRIFSTYKPESEISRFDRGELTTATCSEDVLEVLEACEQLRVDTGGYFDAWVARAGTPAHLDPSGYVKGWAVARAARVLDAAGVTSYCINAGGDVDVRAAADEQPWRVGVRHPTEPHRVAAVVETGDLAIATSAAYERGDHVLDPHRGDAPAGIVSLTVVGQDLAIVDAYATAAFAMGADGPQWVAAQPGYGVFAVTDSGRTLTSPLFEAVRA